MPIKKQILVWSISLFVGALSFGFGGVALFRCLVGRVSLNLSSVQQQSTKANVAINILNPENFYTKEKEKKEVDEIPHKVPEKQNNLSSKENELKHRDERIQLFDKKLVSFIQFVLHMHFNQLFMRRPTPEEIRTFRIIVKQHYPIISDLIEVELLIDQAEKNNNIKQAEKAFLVFLKKYNELEFFVERGFQPLEIESIHKLMESLSDFDFLYKIEYEYSYTGIRNAAKFFAYETSSLNLLIKNPSKYVNPHQDLLDAIYRFKY